MEGKSFERVRFIVKLCRKEDNLSVLDDGLYVLSKNNYEISVSCINYRHQ